MAKISPVSGKYIIRADIKIDGVVDRPDIIGAIFGQTEGLLGAQLELRELQRSGRIGRIEVNTQSKAGKTIGDIVIPSSLDKAETVIVAAALEIIERIGPCNSTILVDKIEDIRVSKRNHVIKRAKELLQAMQTTVLPDSQDLADQVAESVRVMEITNYGKDKLAAGPGIDSSDDIIVVEGRADVVTLLKHGFKNVIAMNGSNITQTLIDLCKTKEVTVFVDGDRGGILNVKELIEVTEIDFVARAPDGKEVEELALKEIHKALRSKVAPDQMKSELASKDSLRTRASSANARASTKTTTSRSDKPPDRNSRNTRPERSESSDAPRTRRPVKPTDDQMKTFETVLEELVGSHAAALLDESMNTLGKVPVAELESTIEGFDDGIFAVVVDGSIVKSQAKAAEKAHVKFIVCRESSVKPAETRTNIITIA
ncbi:MAG: DNA primase [Candidatus Woesearchaeota archaeon]|jgi:DNA primase